MLRHFSILLESFSDFKSGVMETSNYRLDERSNVDYENLGINYSKVLVENQF
jgi:hypothetical protein